MANETTNETSFYFVKIGVNNALSLPETSEILRTWHPTFSCADTEVSQGGLETCLITKSAFAKW